MKQHHAPDTGHDNPGAARLEACLSILMDAAATGDDAELEKARRQVQQIASMSDEDVLALAGGEDVSQAPVQHSRGDFLDVLQYEAPRIPAATFEGRHGGQWIEARELAGLYASLYTSMEEAGKGPPATEVAQAREELEPHGWTVKYHSGAWYAVDIEGDDGGGEEEAEDAEDEDEEDTGPAQHKRVKLDSPEEKWRAQDKSGRWYALDHVPRHAQPGGGAKRPKKPGVTSEAAKEVRRARGLDRSTLKNRLAGHAEPELNAHGKRRAAASLRLLQRHHGELALHRVEELVDLAEDAMKRAEAAGKSGLVDDLRRKLSRFHYMVGLAEQGKAGAGEQAQGPKDSPAPEPQQPSTSEATRAEVLEPEPDEPESPEPEPPAPSVAEAPTSPSGIDYSSVGRGLGEGFPPDLREKMFQNLDYYKHAPDSEVAGRLEEIAHWMRHPSEDETDATDWRRQMALVHALASEKGGLLTIQHLREKAGVKVPDGEGEARGPDEEQADGLPAAEPEPPQPSSPDVPPAEAKPKPEPEQELEAEPEAEQEPETEDASEGDESESPGEPEPSKSTDRDYRTMEQQELQRAAVSEKAARNEMFDRLMKPQEGAAGSLLGRIVAQATPQVQSTIRDDIVGTVALKLLEAMDRAAEGQGGYNPEANLNGYLYTMAQNAYRDYRRRKGNQSHVGVGGGEEEYDPADTRSESAEDEVSRREEAERLEQAVKRLKPEYAEAVRLRLLDGLKAGEAAKRAGVSRVSFNKRFNKGAALLSQMLGIEIGGGDDDDEGGPEAYRKSVDPHAGRVQGAELGAVRKSGRQAHAAAGPRVGGQRGRGGQGEVTRRGQGTPSLHARLLGAARRSTDPWTRRSLFRQVEAERLRYGREDASPGDDRSDAAHLAHWYADLFSLMTAAGSPPSHESAEAASAELHGTGWTLEHDASGSWEAVRVSAHAETYDRAGSPLRYAGQWQHSPTARTRNRWYNSTTDKYRYQVDQPGSKEERDRHSGARVAKRSAQKDRWQSRGEVDAATLRTRIGRHVGTTQINAHGKQRAAAAWRMLQRHHGEHALHRVEDLVREATAALRKTPAGKPGVRDGLKQQLGRLRHVLDLARPVSPPDEAPVGAGDTGKGIRPAIVTARPEQTRPADVSVVPERLRPFLVSPDGSDHQLQGAAKAVAALDSVGGFLLADGPGAGKTRQALAVAATYAARGKKVVLVAPAGIIKPDWRTGEISGSIGKDGKAMGVELALNKGDAIGPGEVHVSTYEQLGRLKDHIDKDTVVIFDEAHGLKNAESQRSLHGKEVATRAGGVVYGTATPADQALDVAYLFRTQLFGDEPWNSVRKRFNPDRVGAAVALKNTADVFDRLTDMGVMVKREVSLDGVEARFDHVELSPEALADLDRVKAGATTKDCAGVLMRQRYLQEKHKIPHAANAVKEEMAQGRQVVVFVAGVSGGAATGGAEGQEGVSAGGGTAGLLRKALLDAGVPDDAIGELHGGEGGGGKEVVQAFQDGKHKVIITTAASGGTGHNLDDVTGKSPRTQVIVTAPFSAIDNAQMWGRTHRLTTRSASRMRYLFADTEVDRWNADLIRGKVQSLGAIVAGEVQKQNIPEFPKREPAAGSTMESPAQHRRAGHEQQTRAVKSGAAGRTAVAGTTGQPRGVDRGGPGRTGREGQGQGREGAARLVSQGVRGDVGAGPSLYSRLLAAARAAADPWTRQSLLRHARSLHGQA